MTTRGWLLMGCGAALLGGCAGLRSERVAAAEAPRADSRGGAGADQDLRVGVQADPIDVAGARVARDDARQFAAVSGAQLRAANTHLDAAQSALDSAEHSGTDLALRAAADDLQRAQDRLIAARLKHDYAARLISLREAQIRECEAELAMERADSREGEGLERDRARTELALARQMVAAQAGQAANLRQAWELRRRDVASRTDYTRAPFDLSAPSSDPSAPSRMVAPSPVPSSPEPGPTEVNEGPSAPQSIPDQNFAH